MPRATMAAAVLACLSLTAGCSGSGPVSAAIPAATKDSTGTNTAAEPAAIKDPLAGLSAAEIWAESQKDVAKAKSVHMAVKLQVDGVWTRCNLKMTSNKAFGTIREGKTKIAVRRIGKVLYFRGNKALWKENNDEASAAKLAGHWIKTTKGESKYFKTLFKLTDMTVVLEEFLGTPGSDVENWEMMPGKSIGGQNTVGISDTPGGEKTAESGFVFIASAELAFPMNIDIGVDGKQYMKFRGWNKPVRVVVPQGAVEYENVAQLL